MQCYEQEPKPKEKKKAAAANARGLFVMYCFHRLIFAGPGPLALCVFSFSVGIIVTNAA